MEFALTLEQRQFDDSLRGFLADRLPMPQLRALADNLDLAETTGFDTRRLIVITWAVGGGLAGLAGALYVLSTGAFNPQFGFTQLLPLFAAVLIGGERGSMIDLSTTVPGFSVRIREFYVGHAGSWFVVQYSVTSNMDPQSQFDSLFPGVQQMVATWRWLA